MPRKKTLTDEERKQNRKNLQSNSIRIYPNDHLLSKIDKFSIQYRSRNSAIIDLIKTHPEFLKMFPKPIKLTIKQLSDAIK